MKSINATMLVCLLVLSICLTACGGNDPSDADVLEQMDEMVNEVEEEFEKIESELQYENDENMTEVAEETIEWKQFLTEYEAWVDKFIDITKKYMANPADMSLLSSYTSLVSEMTDWTTKTEEMEKELENASPGELAQYSAELARIAAKLAQVAY